MEKQELLALFDREQRIEVTYPDIIRQALPNIVRHIPQSSGNEGYVIYSNLDENTVEDAIQEQIAFFKAQGLSFEWKVYDHDTPEDLKERLAAHGLVEDDPEALVVLDLEDALPVLLEPVRHDIRRLTRVEELADIRAVQEAVWDENFDSLIAYLADTMQHSPDQISVYAAYVDGHPAATAWIVFHPGSSFASLWGGSTLATYRGRGCYTALLATRVQEAQSRGVQFLTVDASPMSRPILEKYHFRFLGFSTPFKWQPESS